MPSKRSISQKSSEKAANKPTSLITDDNEVSVTEEYFDWSAYLKKTSSSVAPNHFFTHVIADQDAGFDAGMKLEVPNNSVPGTYWVARVVVRCGHLLLLRYEGYQENSKADFWCSSYSTSLHPVGWCSKTGHALRPPVDFKDKSIDWFGYLIRNLTGSRTAAGCLFGREPCLINRLRPGMYVEITDIQDPYRYWVASICALYSGRICFQYVGTSDITFDVWLYYTSSRVHPPGWGTANDCRMLPPKSLLQRYSKDDLFLALDNVVHNSTDFQILQTCFKGSAGPIKHHQFKRGMKLEARHPNDPTVIGAATVSRVFDEFYFLVQIDNLLRWPGDDADSFVCHGNSNGIYPIGWCQQFGLRLLSPTGFNGNFTWDSYLKYTKCQSAPEYIFPNKSIADHGFELGMKLECVDQENLANICVGTVSQIVGNTLWLSFDGESRSEQIYDAKSTDLFPTGWCAASGHELQWPRPNTIAQKNRISRLRATSERRSRLVHLRKGHDQRTSPKKTTILGVPDPRTRTTRDSSTNSRLKPKRALRYIKGGRRFKRRQAHNTNDNSDNYTDPSTSVFCIARLAIDLNTEENIRVAFHLDDDVIPVDENVTTTTSTNVLDQVITPNKTIERPSDAQIKRLSCLGLRPKHFNEEDVPITHEAEGQTDIEKRSARKRKLSSIVAGLKLSSDQVKKLKLIDHDMKRKHSSLTNSVNEKRHGLTSESSLVGSEANGAANVPIRGSQVAAPSVPSNVPRTKSTMRLAHQLPTVHPINTISNPPKTVITGDNKDGPRNALQQLPKEANGHYQVIGNIVTKDGSHKLILKYTQSTLDNAAVYQQLLPRTKANCVIQFGHGPRPIQPKPISKIDQTVSSASVSLKRHRMLNSENKECRVCSSQEKKKDRKNWCKSFEEMLKGLPRYPNKWSKQQVARFIQGARLNKYARMFVEQDIDGHSLMLLTFHELHSVLKIPVAFASALFDYINLLKRRVSPTS